MNFLPALAIWQFALAGAVCAAGPVILHLLNRRRYRVVEWGAMQFLRDALQRRRRILRIRDLLLMLLRSLAVLFFGLALSRPFFAARTEQLDAGQPIHAVLLIDNSLSMGFQTLAGTLLERARERAAAFIERLPTGSRISVLPLCGSEQGTSPEPFDAKPFALEALQRITVVDRSVRFAQIEIEARRAAELAPELPPRFVLFTDRQRINWQDLARLGRERELPSMQIVDVSDSEWDNAWVADVRVPDGVADAETPTTIQVLVRYHGREPRRDVRVGLWVRDQEVDAQVVRLESADATREVTFQQRIRDVQPEAARLEFVPIKVAISPDRLPEDDERHLLVPVVAALPVVFVDQYGGEEDPVRNRLGETRHLRHLLAPATLRSNAARPLIQIRHVQIGELDRDLLADARLVVIAGVADPAEQVPLLREYVEQGGELILAAGADFDPVAWNASAWRDGRGILPLPLLPDLLGSLPEVAGRNLKPMLLSYESLGQHPYFQLAGNSEDDLRDLYAEPFFFQAVLIDSSPAAFQSAALASDTSTTEPEWLLWTPPEDGGGAAQTAQQAGTAEPNRPVAPAARRPRILARFTSETGPIFLVERPVGRGHVVFVSSGLLSSWNTLPKTNAIVMFDRILRSRLQATQPNRNYTAVDRIETPLPDGARHDRILLFRPGRTIGESLDAGFLRTDQVGVTIERPLSRGIYRLQVLDAPPPLGSPPAPPRWQLELAVHGDEAESDLEPVDRGSFEQQPAGQFLRWVGPQEEISLAGARIRGQDLWWWLALVVLVLLLLEPAVITWPALADRSAARQEGVP
jgi:hypothetical protein